MAASGVNLATAYVTLTPTTKGIGGAIDQAFGGAEDAAKKAGDKSGGGFVSKLGGVLKKGALAVGAAAGGVLATSLFKGWNRLGNIENATAKLSGLGHSADSVKSIMDNALASVKGTAFGVDEAATVAASAVAAGIKPGQDLQRTLGLVGDAATIGGTSLGEMGAIFNKVASSGKVTGRELNQLNMAGIPIVQLLGKSMGKTSDEITKMVSKGQVSFADFEKAIEQGMGGAALKSGETTRGAFKNMGAALGRFGAQLLKDVFPLAKSVFGGITSLLDRATAAAGPFVESLSGRIGPALERLGGAVTGLFALFARGDYTAGLGKALGVDEDSGLIDGLFRARDELGRLGGVFTSLWGSALKLVTPVKDILASLGMASAAIGISSWQVLIALLEVAADLVGAVLVPAITALSGWMKDNQTAVTLLAGAFVVWRLVLQAISFGKLIAGLVTSTKTIALKTAAWVRNTAAMIASKAQTVALAALYAKDFVVGLARSTAALAASTARWIANTAALVAAKAVQLAITTATKAWTAAQWLLNAALNANPLGLLLAAVAALVAGLIWAWNSSETFRNIVMGAFKAVGDFVGGIVDWVVNAFSTALGWVKSNWPLLLAIISGPVGWVIALIIKFKDQIIGAFAAAWDWIKSSLSAVGQFFVDIWDGITAGVTTAVNAVLSVVSTVWNTISSLVSRVVGGIRDTVVGVWNSIVDTGRTILGGLASIVGGAFDAAVSGIKGVINGVIGLINSGIGFINSALIDTFNKIPFVPDIPHIPKIPTLAAGGITTGPTLAMIGEGREQEVVLPLSKLEAMLPARGDGDQRPVIQVFPRQEIDVPALARQIQRELAWATA